MRSRICDETLPTTPVVAETVKSMMPRREGRLSLRQIVWVEVLGVALLGRHAVPDDKRRRLSKVALNTPEHAQLVALVSTSAMSVQCKRGLS